METVTIPIILVRVAAWTLLYLPPVRLPDVNPPFGRAVVGGEAETTRHAKMIKFNLHFDQKTPKYLYSYRQAIEPRDFYFAVEVLGISINYHCLLVYCFDNLKEKYRDRIKENKIK